VGAQDEREAGQAGLQRHAQDGRGEATPLLLGGGGGRCVPAHQLGPAPQPRGVGWRWVRVPRSCSASPLWSCGVGSGFGFWLCGGLGGFVDGFGTALICIWVTWPASLFPSRCCSIRCLHSSNFMGIFTLFIHVRKFSCESLVPF
jgi:hypothetical protein